MLIIISLQYGGNKLKYCRIGIEIGTFPNYFALAYSHIISPKYISPARCWHISLRFQFLHGNVGHQTCANLQSILVDVKRWCVYTGGYPSDFVSGS